MNKKDIIVNLNFDDFHPQNSYFGDFGGLEGENLKKITQLLDEFTDLKITMFTVPNWIDVPYTKHRYWYKIRELLRIFPVVSPNIESPYLLRKNKNWCQKVRDLVRNDKLEIAVHGFFHHNPYRSIHGQEFFNLNYEETKQRILLAEAEFNYNSIPFVKAFRPPGWGTNIYLPRVLKDLNYDMYATNSSGSKTCDFEYKDFLLSLPQNWSIKEDPQEALRLAEKYGRVFMKGHIAFKYGLETIENGINEIHWNNLRNALHLLTQNYNVTFVTLQDCISKHRK